jgi:hypothetical protein
MINIKAYNKLYYLKHKNMLKFKAKVYKKSHRTQYNQYNKIYRLKHVQNIKEYSKKYRKSHRNIKTRFCKICSFSFVGISRKLCCSVKCNQEYNFIYGKNYRRINKQKIKEYNLNYYNKRRKFEIYFRLCLNLRNRINIAIRNNQKSGNTLKLIGCSIEFLKQHLENQFTKGMTWKNYGRGKNKWNIDHIKPCASFNLTKESEQKKCFNYTNLQPLWSIDNIRKSYFEGKRL